MQLVNSSINNKRILLAEDCDDSREILKFLFTKSGAKVETACNGGECVDLALDALNQSNPFDVIVLDIHMPVVDGNAATRQLRSHGYKLPIVAMTGQASEEEERLSISSGCNAFLSKLSSRDKMISVIEGLLPKNVVDDSLPALPFVPEILSREPEYAPLVLKFIDTLDTKMQLLEKEIYVEAWHNVIELCSALSSGSIYGYRIFADHLSHLQAAVCKSDKEEIRTRIRMLKQSAKSIELGRKEVEKIVNSKI